MATISLKQPPLSQRWLAAFALAAFVFHQLPALAGGRLGDAIDLVTPFAVIGAAAALLAVLNARGPALVLAVAAAVLYIDGHGIHLAANSIRHEPLIGDAEDVAHFWDERFGHIEWHVGWIGLAAAFCVAERGPGEVALGATAVTAALLGFVLFTNAVEGGTWWLMLAAAAVFSPWALRSPRPLLITCAAAFALAALLIGIWAAWHGGLPEFSEVGII